MRRRTHSFDDPEDGFTLLELLVCVVVIGILAGIALPVYLNTIRTATNAAVESSVRNSISDVQLWLLNNPAQHPSSATEYSSAGGTLQYADDETYLDVAAAADGSYILCGYNTGSQKYPTADKAFYFDSKTGQFVDAASCDDAVTSGGVAGGQSNPTSTPVPTPTTTATTNPTTAPTSTPVPSPTTSTPAVPSANADFDLGYYPQTNKLSFCNTLLIKATVATSSEWQYTIDLSQAPFYGANPTSDFYSVYGIRTVSKVGSLWTIAGLDYNKSISTITGNITVGWCVNAPEPLTALTGFNTQITYSSDSNNWNACIDINPTTDSKYPLIWSATVDLSAYFKNYSALTVISSTRLLSLPLGNGKYYLVGLAGDSRYLSATNPQNITHALCVNPLGNANWKVQ